MDKVTPFQFILTGAFVVIAIVAIFIFANFQGFGGGSKVEVGTVVIWGTLPEEAMEQGIGDLINAQKEYAKVSYIQVSEYSFSASLANAIASGEGPDLIVVSQEMLQAERGKITLIPFSSFPQRTFIDSYLPLFEAFLTSEGTYGIPLVADPLVLYYNKNMLSSAGIVFAPTTWESVSGMAPAVTRRTDAGGVTRSLIALGEYGNVRNARATVSLLLLQSGTTITQRTEQGVRSTLADEESTYGLTPAQSAMNFYVQFADPAKTTYSWNRSLPESRASFTAGDLALYLGFASERAFIADANPNLTFDMAPVPSPATLENRLTYGVGYAFAIPKASINPTGAYAAAYALSAPAAAEAIAANLGMAPARKASLLASNDDKYSPIFYKEALIARGWLSPAPSTTDSIFSVMISDIATGRRSVEQAIQVASAAITAASQ